MKETATINCATHNLIVFGIWITDGTEDGDNERLYGILEFWLTLY